MWLQLLARNVLIWSVKYMLILFLVAPDAYWLFKSNRYDSSLSYLQDHQCISVQSVDVGNTINDREGQNTGGESTSLRCTQPSALFDGEIGRKIPILPENGDLLKHYTWKKEITPNPFVAMKFVEPLIELTNITLYFYKKASMKVNLPFISLCVSSSSDLTTQCNQVELPPRLWFPDGVVAWPITLLIPAKSVTYLKISFQYELENIHQWIFLSEVRVGERIKQGKMLHTCDWMI